MKAVVLRETGGPERLVVEDVPEPEAEDGAQVLEVRAAGINFLDVLVRLGRYPQPPPLPAILGVEVAGELDGRRVMALTRHSGGGYAERAATDPAWIYPLPETATFEEGASFLMTFVTAWLALERVREGATVVVHAAAGGVGTAAVQLAKHRGARVVATAGSDEKRRFVLELGADEAHPYERVAGAVKADVVVDMVGGELFSDSVALLEPQGEIVAVGYAGGMWPEVNPALLVGRNVAVRGLYVGRLMRHAPEVVQAAAQRCLELWEAGAVSPVVGATFPLERAADAHRLVEDRKSVGKVVLVP
jgi:NADPH2:quinone reductase